MSDGLRDAIRKALPMEAALSLSLTSTVATTQAIESAVRAWLSSREVSPEEIEAGKRAIRSLLTAPDRDVAEPLIRAFEEMAEPALRAARSVGVRAREDD